MRKMKMVVKKINMKEHDDEAADLQYWLSRSPAERLAAVTMLSRQFMKPGQQMDRTHISFRKMKP